ncbi:MAG TPA: rhodanese-like domain-containing protein [Bacteroidota bacterium]|nr:rhodanese-like domain-containing protein [Bacteroidota bacterium]
MSGRAVEMFGFGVAAFAGFWLMQQSGSTVSVEEAYRLITTDSSVIVLDVRTPEEFTGNLGHISSAVLLPVQELQQRLAELETYKEKTILAVCRTGRRSAKAVEILTGAGFKACNVEGGMVRWNEKGLPSVKEE